MSFFNWIALSCYDSVSPIQRLRIALSCPELGQYNAPSSLCQDVLSKLLAAVTNTIQILRKSLEEADRMAEAYVVVGKRDVDVRIAIPDSV